MANKLLDIQSTTVLWWGDLLKSSDILKMRSREPPTWVLFVHFRSRIPEMSRFLLKYLRVSTSNLFNKLEHYRGTVVLPIKGPN